MYEFNSKDVENIDSQLTEKLLPNENFVTKRDKWIRIPWKPWVIHGALLILNTLFYVYTWRSRSRSFFPCVHNGRQIYSPAAKVVEFVQVQTEIDASSPFKGNPSKEGDEAWSNLLQGYNTRLSKDMLHKIGQESLLLADGSGDHWGIMKVFHNLHCLKEIRQELAPEYYGINKTKHMNEGHIFAPHIDVTMLTWYWPDEQPAQNTGYYPQTNYTFQNECVDWEKLQSWAIEHSFELSPETIYHPKYGYPW